VLFPGGGIDSKENAVQAAKREFAEEAARRLTNCTVAHPPTLQIWPAGYKATGKSWKKDYDGGQTVWMTGSCSDEIQDNLRHKDFAPSLSWKPVAEVIDKLRALTDGDWAADNRTRLAILEAHQKMRLDRA
jgi:8-oxo-dGTP pyrophosphatase MutT (NUDIX family)